MKMAKHIGNISKEFDFSGIIKSILDESNGHRDIVTVFDKDGNPRSDLPEGSFLRKLTEDLYKAGYKDPVWNGITYYPYTHFPEDIVYFLDKKFGTICTQCWINKVKPNAGVAPHRDWDDREEELSKWGESVRYSLHLGDPDPGHIFWIEGQCMYMQPQGEIYQWDDPLSLHGGSNSGYTNKYLLVYRGIKPYKKFDFEYVWQNDNDSVKFKLPDGRII
jgi:hypothetical protein